MPALVALKDANFGTVLFDRIGRASSQMRITAAFDAAKRPNKSLFLDDEGTLLHSPAPNPRRSDFMQSDKGCEIWTVPKFPVKSCAKRPRPGKGTGRLARHKAVGSQAGTRGSEPGLLQGPRDGNVRRACFPFGNIKPACARWRPLIAGKPVRGPAYRVILGRRRPRIFNLL
jgi:hypothetical protein